MINNTRQGDFIVQKAGKKDYFLFTYFDCLLLVLCCCAAVCQRRDVVCACCLSLFLVPPPQHRLKFSEYPDLTALVADLELLISNARLFYPVRVWDVRV